MILLTDVFVDMLGHQDDLIDGCIDICWDAKVILSTEVLTYDVTLR